MISKKISTLNTLINKNKMTQKLVVVGDYNKLWDDVEALELRADDIQDEIDSIPVPEPVIRDLGLTGTITAVAQWLNVALVDDGNGNGIAAFSPADAVIAINYDGIVDPLTYTLTGADGTITGSPATDLNDIVVTVVYADLGSKTWTLTITDGSITGAVTITANVDDPLSIGQ